MNELNYGRVYDERDTGGGFESSVCYYDAEKQDFGIEPFTEHEYKNYPPPKGEVTPEKFAEWLESNKDNFHQDREDVDFFISDFRAEFLTEARKAA